jgi:hypothetical protein
VERDRIADRGMEPLELIPGSSSRRESTLTSPPRPACCALIALMMLARACSVQSARGSAMPPVVSELTVTSGRITSSSKSPCGGVKWTSANWRVWTQPAAATLSASATAIPKWRMNHSPGPACRAAPSVQCLRSPERQVKNRDF